ncbi:MULTISPECIES: roadblock/LC7 domain-containing protein [unclassified Crossiella]|uniref:roadblock/LC7 domain-containing protein n=1 Tax=unclassified Crossiella TaxID=2620835 RepID=UPI001FFE54A6|nr:MULTISPECIES: roadblock/LC7 domain-containing protein [unclassified Crossiella]MCK2241460.1 roadblock/LC7 domain-containing protein [Crossiella sp. S99.2]MCK2255668.1 roadblock/LC7 domain-containing protein [Crossiella sp. S99.1]
MSSETERLEDFHWLVDDFVNRAAGVSHAVVLSADGLLLAGSNRLPGQRAQQLSAVVSGLVSLTSGAARCFESGEVKQTIVAMERGYLFLMTISDGSCLAALAAPTCDIGMVGYAMARLVERVGPQLTPELRAQLHAAAAVPAMRN